MNQKQRESAKKILTEEFGNNCWGCIDESTVLPKHLEVDHIIPEADGGPDTIDNLALLCGNCNRKKGRGLTIGGLRRENGVKDDQHPVNLKFAMELTRRKAREEHLISIQPRLPLADSREATPVEPQVDEATCDVIEHLDKIRELLHIRDRDNLANLLCWVTKITYYNAFDDWGNSYVIVCIQTHKDWLEAYNYLLNLSGREKEAIGSAVRDILWGSKGGCIQVEFSLEKSLEKTSARYEAISGGRYVWYGGGYDRSGPNDPVDDLPF